MDGSLLALGANVYTLAQAASVLVMGFCDDRFGRRRVLAGGFPAAGTIRESAPDTFERGRPVLMGRSLNGITLGSILTSTIAIVGFVNNAAEVKNVYGLRDKMSR